MVPRPGYRTQAQKEGKSAGQRARRQVRERKRQMRDLNLYEISARSSVVSKARHDNNELAVYGIYEDGGKWVLSAMAIRRNEEKLVSDRQGATKSEVVCRAVVTPQRGGLDPRDGLELSRFDTKKAAMSEVFAETSTRVDSGMYVVRANELTCRMRVHKVDRNEYREWVGSHAVNRVRA